jgi:hypothetical protein
LPFPNEHPLNMEVRKKSEGYGTIAEGEDPYEKYS